MKKKLASIICVVAVWIGASTYAGETPASFTYQGLGEVVALEPGAVLFTNRSYVVKECPDSLAGKMFLRNSISDTENWTITKAGVLTLLTPIPIPAENSPSRTQEVKAAGFQEVAEIDVFQLFGKSEIDQVSVWQKQVVPGERFSFGKWVVAVGFDQATPFKRKPWSENRGELLYNGIRLPEMWPPRDIQEAYGPPMPVPYLDYPPTVIPIDVGRQLFIDDFLIEDSSLTRSYHKPVKYEGNPVLKPETELEINRIRVAPLAKGHEGAAAAVPKSGGIWWDPDAQHFKMWYEAGWLNTICMATSADGLHWQRAEYDIRPGTNQVLPTDITPDSWTVIRNWEATDPDEKWTMFLRPPGGHKPGICMTSPDGIHWKNRVDSKVIWGDRSTHIYNPFRKKWVFSIRAFFGSGRARKYFESDQFLMGPDWGKESEEVIWLSADEVDGTDYLTGDRAQLYNFDAVAYESIMLGQFQLHWGPANPICEKAGLPKITELQFTYSRDGFHFDRPDRRIHIPAERKDVWDRGYVQSVGTICTVMGDELWFYYSAFQGDSEKTENGYIPNGMYDRGATGIAKLRRDGFASMEAGDTTGELTTRPVRFSGSRLFVNVEAPEGELRAELLDASGRPIQPFTLANCHPITADSTLQAITWEGSSDLSEWAGKPVQLRFQLKNGALYSFWVSQDTSGRSDGYVAGGGPGYTGFTDTVGIKALPLSH